jgi:hypothetical protein
VKKLAGGEFVHAQLSVRPVCTAGVVDQSSRINEKERTLVHMLARQRNRVLDS